MQHIGQTSSFKVQTCSGLGSIIFKNTLPEPRGYLINIPSIFIFLSFFRRFLSDSCAKFRTCTLLGTRQLKATIARCALSRPFLF